MHVNAEQAKDPTSMIVSLPTINSDMAGFDVLAKLSYDTQDVMFDEVVIDMSRCFFFDANMAATLSAIIAHIKDNINTVLFTAIQPGVEKILRKNDFLLNYGYPFLVDKYRTTLAHKRFNVTDMGMFVEYLNKYLFMKKMPKMTDGVVLKIKQGVLEVFSNAVTHSGAELGIYVCGQYYPKEKHINLSISDTGMGIRESVRKKLDKKIGSVNAIKWALTEGCTSRTGAVPGGMGLKFLKDFISQNEGKIQIASRKGYYEFTSEQERYERLKYDLPGTTVNIVINTSDQRSYRLESESKRFRIF